MKEYRVTMAGTGADAAEWRCVATGFGSVVGAARWIFDSYDTDDLEAPVRIERKTGAFWRDCLVAFPAGVASVEAWEARELAQIMCGLLGQFRRACYQGDMNEEERAYFVGVLDMVEGSLCSNLRADDDEDANVLRAIARFRRALLQGGLSDEERDELAMPDGFLDEVEAFVLRVLE